jgi:hypothetical protein
LPNGFQNLGGTGPVSALMFVDASYALSCPVEAVLTPPARLRQWVMQRSSDGAELFVLRGN